MLTLLEAYQELVNGKRLTHTSFVNFKFVCLMTPEQVPASVKYEVLTPAQFLDLYSKYYTFGWSVWQEPRATIDDIPEIPRRQCLDRLTKPELAIHEAIILIEESVHTGEAITLVIQLLNEAKNVLADVVEEKPITLRLAPVHSSYPKILTVEMAANLLEWYDGLKPNQKCTVHPPAGSNASFGIYELAKIAFVKNWLGLESLKKGLYL